MISAGVHPEMNLPLIRPMSRLMARGTIALPHLRMALRQGGTEEDTGT